MDARRTADGASSGMVDLVFRRRVILTVIASPEINVR